jgi:hypothetical protein
VARYSLPDDTQPLIVRLEDAAAKQRSCGRQPLAQLLAEARARIIELEPMELRVRTMMRSERHDSGWNRHLKFILEGR